MQPTSVQRFTPTPAYKRRRFVREVERRVHGSSVRPQPVTAEPEKTAPEPDPGPRFGIWNDGVLALRVRAGFIELEADEFDALVNFLDRIRAGEVS